VITPAGRAAGNRYGSNSRFGQMLHGLERNTGQTPAVGERIIDIRQDIPNGVPDYSRHLSNWFHFEQKVPRSGFTVQGFSSEFKDQAFSLFSTPSARY
jgi:hypothetical protein